MTDSQILGSSSGPVVKAAYWFPDGETKPTGSVIPQSSAILIDSTLFTHLFCAFADLDLETHRVFIPQRHEYEFSTFTEIVRSLGFYGLDLAWEYPNNDVEMNNFGKLLQEWRSAVEVESQRTGIRPLLLTAAVYYTSDYNSVSYPVQAINRSLDWVNLIAYEFYGLTTEIGPPAGLYDPSIKGINVTKYNPYVEKAGLPEKKAVFGFPYVGWSWTLDDDKDHGDDVAVTHRVAVTANGSINYDQIVKFITEYKARTVYDSEVVGFYCIAGTT
ncbi:putative protein [Arabidopsis thaliana]|uniref:Uncharacterized protein AT4g19740 n=1 Tax=Arabidopsis thaliana TaxID=3702 RepID=O81855_ARATH|nr:putative protein [Arabidopsis thaliana]CAB78976.1 putative protein [Arabidopsis thaliana]